jgi:hypothetical protein
VRVSLREVRDTLFTTNAQNFPSSRNNAKGLSAKLCKALFNENAPALVCAHQLLENGKVDGIYLSEVEELCNDYGKEQVAHGVKRFIDILCDCFGDTVCELFYLSVSYVTYLLLPRITSSKH